MTINKYRESSDFVTRFKEFSTKVPKPDVLAMPLVAPPKVVSDRIKERGLTWEDLPLLAKYAVVWDSGFVVGNVNGADTWVQVLVGANKTMASIQLSKAAFLAIPKSATRECSDSGGDLFYRQQSALAAETDKAVQCVIDLPTGRLEASMSSVWAQDALTTTQVPNLRLYNHTDNSPNSHSPSIHGLNTRAEVPWDECALQSHGSGMIIPCVFAYRAKSSTLNQLPQRSTAMDQWLTEILAAKNAPKTAPPATTGNNLAAPTASVAGGVSEGSSNTGLIVGIAVGVLVVIAAIAFFFCRRRRQEVPKQRTSYSGIQTPTVDRTITEGTAGVNLENLQLYRLDEKDLVLTSKLGAGAFADVFRGTYRGMPIAAKKMHASRINNTQLASFIDEITLMASFDSPNIVKLVGAAWTRALDLTCVMELMDGGDLKDFLDTHVGENKYPWNAKYEHIYSVAEGLSYLHSMNIIHRDLKSRNILLDSTKNAKLTDFGISKEDIQATMTLGVGTFRWMAPEIIQDQSYTVAADVYSFGCVLTEFDTHHVPYEDMKNPANGQPISDSSIMVKVVAGTIKPTITASCPDWIAALATKCLAHDPADRPTVNEIVYTMRVKLRELSSTQSNNN